MGIYYYAIDHARKKYFSAPDDFGITNPSIYHPENPFPHMVIMMNCYGSSFSIEDDCSNDIPPDSEYKEITEEVYKMYLDKFKDHFQPERSKREDSLDSIRKKSCDLKEKLQEVRDKIIAEMRCSEHDGNAVRDK